MLTGRVGTRLRGQEQAVDRIIEAVSDIALVVENDGRISDVHLGSPFASEETGTWLGKSWTDTVTTSTRAKVEELIAQARSEGVSRHRQVNHRLPSGSEVAVGYTAVRLGDSDAVLAVGRSLEVVSELQRKLVDAQQRMERDYWRLRQVETRYRLLFRLSSEAVLMIDPDSLEVLDANQAAGDALGVAAEELIGGTFPADLLDDPARFRDQVLPTVLEKGTAPGLPVTFPESGRSWFLKLSLVQHDHGDSAVLVHMHPRGVDLPRAAPGSELQLRLLDGAPDGFVVTDESGKVLHANASFLEMAEVSSSEALVGRSLGDWLGRPGADLTVLLTNLKRYGVVRLFPTQIAGAMGTDVDVELSAVHVEKDGAGYCGILVRHVGRRIERPDSGGDELARAVEDMTSDLGQTTLRKLVRQTVTLVERHFIEAALELTGDNRTAAAELLGLSRQSLYTKLRRYDIQGVSNDGDS